MAPAAHARLVERFLFNFRVSPAALRQRLPVPWLEPQLINGYGVVTLCVLQLSHVTLAPLPAFAPVRSFCWAYRFGVIDHSISGGRPSVYVLERPSDSPLINWAGPRLFRASFPYSRVNQTSYDGVTGLYATHADGNLAFAATASVSTQSQSRLFGTVDELQRFIKEGVSSYTLSTEKERLVRIDLFKEETPYEPLDVLFCYASILDEWQETSLIFDSAFRTRGGSYRWQYQGEMPLSTVEGNLLKVAV